MRELLGLKLGAVSVFGKKLFTTGSTYFAPESKIKDPEASQTLYPKLSEEADTLFAGVATI